MLELAGFIAALVLLLPGIAMAFVPLLPALPYMFAVALTYGLIDGFSALSGKEIAILLCIALVSMAIDQISGVLGAKLGGAHARSLLWGIAGGVFGTLVVPALGSFAGLFVGVLAGEIYYKKTGRTAFKAAGGALLGAVAGVAVNVVLAVAFAFCFFFFARG
ncbi:MAG: DUF456 domain-containing protein [Candidatus Taylorbacteria bacterium]|nr:DUF456 domain-containing protein [Candidatus Taylorbacteria bacterium]